MGVVYQNNEDYNIKLKKKKTEEMTEWLKVADCKSVRKFLRRFESYFLQNIGLTRFELVTLPL